MAHDLRALAKKLSCFTEHTDIRKHYTTVAMAKLGSSLVC